MNYTDKSTHITEGFATPSNSQVPIKWHHKDIIALSNFEKIQQLKSVRSKVTVQN